MRLGRRDAYGELRNRILRHSAVVMIIHSLRHHIRVRNGSPDFLPLGDCRGDLKRRSSPEARLFTNRFDELL